MKYSRIGSSLSTEYKKKIISFPLRVSLVFIVFTELFLFIGPVNFVVKSPFLLIIFLFIVNFSFYFGYKHGIRAKIKKSNLNMASHGLLFTKYALMISLVLVPIKFFVGWHMENLNAQDIINRFLFGLLSPGDIYFESLELRGVDKSSIYSFILMIFSPFIFIGIPIGVFYYIKLPIRFKVIVILLIFLQIVYTLGTGTRKGLLDIILLIVFPFILANPAILLSRKKWFGYLFFSTLLLSSLIFYFFYSNMSRAGLDTIWEIGGNRQNIKNFYVKNIPQEIYQPLADVQIYLSHSYSNLSIILEKSLFLKNQFPVFTYGLGNNLFTIKQSEEFLGVDLMKRTHQGLLEQSHFVDPFASWHTIYSWLANDFTFWGCPFIIFIIGFYYAKTWREVLDEGNLFALPLFCLLTICVFYFFANNQVISFSFISFNCFLIMYLIFQIRWKV